MENKEVLNESIEDIAKNSFDTSMIVDNKLCFVVEDSLYRVRMPNQGEQSLVENKKCMMQLEYMKQEGCITRNQLITQLKESGVVDIEKLEESKESLTKELKKFWFMLATKDSADKNKIIEYTDKIVKIQDTLQNLSLEISTYLAPCLQSRLDNFYVEYVTYICTEQRVGEEWKRLWDNFDAFNKAEPSLSNKAIASMAWLLINRK
jgi:hypothetical protein